MDELVERIIVALAPWLDEWLSENEKREAARACLSGIEAGGDVIVPKEPTMDMCRAYGPDFLENGAVWRAMLAAAERAHNRHPNPYRVP